MNGNGTVVVREKPLNRGAKGLLILGAGLAMLSFYVFSLCATLFLVILIFAELVLLLALARFGASRLMVPFMEKHMSVLGLFVKSFRLRKGVEFRIPLRPEDAPELHKLLARLCDRLQLGFPDNVSLQMGDGAWVQLKGIRSGAGKTTLGVGYDLLAGLSVPEMEAVLAHEMTHAKLIHRGYRNWLWGAQSRVRNLAMALWGEVSNARRAKRSSSVAEGLFAMVDRLLRLCTRLIAAYSRQDEFEADHGAANLCGAGVMKSALSKLESLHAIASRLPWNERVAQLQQSSGYSAWLLQEIAKGAAPRTENTTEVFFNKYSTHPSIPDRLAALGGDEPSPGAVTSPAIRLLAQPDKIAARLLTELQRLMAEQEKKDSHALEKFSRKTGRYAHLRPLQSFGFFLILGGIVGGLAGLFSGDVILVVSWCVAAVVIGVFFFRLGKYKDSLVLPVPLYEKITEASAGNKAKEDAKEKEKNIQADLAQRFGGLRQNKRALKLAVESYEALKLCDYFRALIAAREALKFDKKSTEGALALAVACAAFGQHQNTARLLAFVQKQSGFKTFSTAWGAAWAGLLAADWIRAEAMLEKALKLEPQQTTLVSLLAIAQSRRGKLQSSIVNARRACEAFPESAPRLKFLIGRLLDGGFTREAQEQMRRLSEAMENDPEVMLFKAQLHLLQQNAPEANGWTVRLKAAGKSAQMLIRAARYYETARLPDEAAALYQEALAADHYPEAHLGLGRIEAGRNNKAEARKHILAALNVERPVGKEGVTTWQIFHPILAQMLGLQEPAAKCGAWMFAFPGNCQPAALAGKSLMIYASDLDQAQLHLKTVVNALHPAKPPMILNMSGWKAAPRPLQPDGPARPGVQGFWQ